MAYKKYAKKEPVVRVGFKPTYSPSPEQRDIFSKFRLDPESMFIGASAGSGKSTTLVWLMALMEEWMKGKKLTSKFMAFNTDIVKDIEPRCPYGVDVSTAHSAGYKVLAKKFGRLYMPKINDKPCKVTNILKEGWAGLFNPDAFSGPEKGKVYSRLFDTAKLIDMLRLTLTDESNPELVGQLMDRYNIDIDRRDDIIEIMPTVFSKIVENPAVIDFTDMMWLAVRLDLDLPKFDMIYLDEVQDFNNLMIEYSFRMLKDDGVAPLVGDKNQSIYGFAGANTKSIDVLKEKFGADEMPLNTCYRCGKSIIELAQTIVPEIMPYEKNPDGEVNRLNELHLTMEDGSMILSRRNANLIKPCFELIKSGRKAIIKGKDIGANIISTINKHRKSDLDGTLDSLREYTESRCVVLSTKENSASAVEALQDTLGVIQSIADECRTVDEVTNRVSLIFDESTKGITLSSIHKSKGLEADHVTIVDYARVRLSNEKMTEDDHIQEKNLHYVAVTRAKSRLDLIV